MDGGGGRMSVIIVEMAELRAMIAAELRAVLAERPHEKPAVGDWLDAKEVARALGVHARTVAKLAVSGRLPSTRIGRLLRFRPSDVSAFLERNAR
jgi:excisionase family DNA binding protein